jgi:hypothetical protein
MHKKTLSSDLIDHGWKVKKNMQKGATPPTIQDLLSTNKDFSRIFNTYDFKKTETRVELPVF